LDGADCQPILKGNLFANFIFFLHESLHFNKQMANIQNLIEKQNGRVVNTLNQSVTHVVIDKL
jgi:hypothetical protein